MPLALFLFVAGWDLGGLFTQLANLSDRYLEAGALRRSLFSQDLKGCFPVLAGAVTLFLMPRFLKLPPADLDNPPPRAGPAERQLGHSVSGPLYLGGCGIL